MAAIIGQQTINHISFLEVDDDPVFTGLDIQEGSFAVWEDGDRGRFFRKVGPNASDWSELEKKIIEVNRYQDQSLVGGNQTQIFYNEELTNDDDRYFDLVTADGEVEIKVGGQYICSFMNAVNIISGSSRSMAVTALYNNGFELFGTRAYSYHRLSAQGAMTVSCINKIFTFNAGDRISVRSRRVSGSAALEFMSDACRMTIERKF